MKQTQKKAMVARIAPILTVDDLELLPDDGSRYELIERDVFVSRALSITDQPTVLSLIQTSIRCSTPDWPSLQRRWSHQLLKTDAPEQVVEARV